MKYMGSKLRIAPYIVNYINNIALCENITEYYEPFMGGCSVGELVAIQNRHLSDINKHVVALMQKVQQGMWEFEFVTNEKWHEVKADRFTNDKFEPWFTGWCSIGCSFRGRCFEGYAGEYIDKTTGNKVNPQRQVYNSLQNEMGKLIGVDFKCRHYDEIGHPHNAVIYCDAPYRGVKQYTMVEKFDFDKYDDWLIEMSKDNLVLISEYSMTGKHADKFIKLDHWTLNKSIGSGQTEDESSVENLYYVKNGWLTDKYFSNNNDDFDMDF